ncbi:MULTISPECIES: hypothetical protein [unclassified Shewanella]|jgi:hypothetical protein|uniref:hypothetical protein n=1 Tax=Shewanella TaxID=22 RepID=UPI000C345E9E|nr:hypothetical protein [Shewanella sp. ALD9]PKH32386.1 hypothetical protein CXF88_11085 [Shewanella sp. ALD9]
MKVKKPSMCNVHTCYQNSFVCKHIKEAAKSNKTINITPLFYERFMLEKYYETKWFCDVCVKKYSIPLVGGILYDPSLRAFVNSVDKEVCVGHKDPFYQAQNDLVGWCQQCFFERYIERVKYFEIKRENKKMEFFAIDFNL